MGQIVQILEIFNFKSFRAEILQIFELLIWKINDFINSFWLYLTFKVRRVLPKWLAQPDIVSLDLGDQQMPIEDMKELDESILQILKSTGAKYFFPVQRQVIPQLIMVKLTTCFHEFSKHEFTIFFLANIMSYLFWFFQAQTWEKMTNDQWGICFCFQLRNIGEKIVDS